jgi:hypothetical protein
MYEEVKRRPAYVVESILNPPDPNVRPAAPAPLPTAEELEPR